MVKQTRGVMELHFVRPFVKPSGYEGRETLRVCCRTAARAKQTRDAHKRVGWKLTRVVRVKGARA